MADETFTHFAYGSNMLLRRLRAEERAPSAVPIGTGFLEGRRLTFDKVRARHEISDALHSLCRPFLPGFVANRSFSYSVASSKQGRLR